MRTIDKEERIKQLLTRRDFGAQVVARGWVRTRRESRGEFSFIELNDGSCLANLQIIADNSLPNYADDVRKLVTGCSLRVEGELRESPGKGQAVELLAKSIEVLGWVEDPESYPLQKKRHTLEFLREIAHLRPRSNTIGAAARVRSCLALATHEFFRERGFVYLHTPIITGSDCEGAGEMFSVTALDLERPGAVADVAVEVVA